MQETMSRLMTINLDIQEIRSHSLPDSFTEQSSYQYINVTKILVLCHLLRVARMTARQMSWADCSLQCLTVLVASAAQSGHLTHQ